MSGLFTAIAAGRYTAGRLWSPSLSLDLMFRDYAGFTVPLQFAASGSTGLSGAYQTLVTLYPFFPDNWLDDDSLDALRVRMAFTMLYTPTGGVITDSAYIKISGEDDTEYLIVDGAETVTLTKDWTTWPAGRETVTIQAKHNGANTATNITAARVLATGPVDWMQVQSTNPSDTSSSIDTTGTIDFPSYTTATEPIAAAVWDRRFIWIKDAAQPAILKACMQKDDDSYAWEIIHIADIF